MSVAITRCGVWPTVSCGVLAVERRFYPYRLLQYVRYLSQQARHTAAVGLKDCSEARKHSYTTMGLAGGRMPATGSTTTRDIGQAEQFAPRMGNSRASGGGNTLSPTLQKMPDNADKLT